MLVVYVDLIAVKNCCVTGVGKLGSAEEGRFGEATELTDQKPDKDRASSYVECAMLGLKH